MRKVHDLIIYRDERFYSAFPSVICRPDGELIVAFRRAPERRMYYASNPSHCDPNSHLVLVRSHDHAKTWTADPELIFAHPQGGSQDPCMVQLDDGTIVLSSYAWMILPTDAHAHKRDLDPVAFGWTFTFLGGYVLRSTDGARSWQGPILPPDAQPHGTRHPHIDIPTFNRGAMVQARDGRLYWAVARTDAQRALDLAISDDRGLTWRLAGPMAGDEKVVFNETSMIQTPAGDLVAFVRTGNFADHGVVVRSTDMGQTWLPWQDMKVVGHPYHATALPDGRVLLVYGYRHDPYGIRARVLDPECTDFSRPELVLRDDGGNGDVGYPWATVMNDGRVLVTYYINHVDGYRYIAGTVLEI